MECGVLPVSALSQNRAKCENLTKVYATAAAANNPGKAAHMSCFCSRDTKSEFTSLGQAFFLLIEISIFNSK